MALVSLSHGSRMPEHVIFITHSLLRGLPIKIYCIIQYKEELPVSESPLQRDPVRTKAKSRLANSAIRLVKQHNLLISTATPTRAARKHNGKRAGRFNPGNSTHGLLPSLIMRLAFAVKSILPAGLENNQGWSSDLGEHSVPSDRTSVSSSYQGCCIRFLPPIVQVYSGELQCLNPVTSTSFEPDQIPFTLIRYIFTSIYCPSSLGHQACSYSSMSTTFIPSESLTYVQRRLNLHVNGKLALWNLCVNITFCGCSALLLYSLAGFDGGTVLEGGSVDGRNVFGPVVKSADSPRTISKTAQAQNIYTDVGSAMEGIPTFTPTAPVPEAVLIHCTTSTTIYISLIWISPSVQIACR
ncbi:uncharacterized protein BT62DRAFT_1078720, partial [Guyanagaster necrorhizus]